MRETIRTKVAQQVKKKGKKRPGAVSALTPAPVPVPAPVPISVNLAIIVQQLIWELRQSAT
jgi:hypothetical protein